MCVRRQKPVQLDIRVCEETQGILFCKFFGELSKVGRACPSAPSL